MLEGDYLLVVTLFKTSFVVNLVKPVLYATYCLCGVIHCFTCVDLKISRFLHGHSVPPSLISLSTYIQLE